MKKLIFVITQPVVGGAQRYVFDLAKRFSDGYQVSVASGGSMDGDLFQKLEKAKIKTQHLKFLGREVKIFNDISAFFELLKLFRKEKPDVIHLNSSKISLLGSMAGYLSGFGRYRKPKIVFTAHGWFFKEDIPSVKKNAAIFYERLAAKFKDKIICVSNDDFEQALKYKIAPPRKLYVVHNAVGEIDFLDKKSARAEISKLAGRDFGEEDILLVNPGRLYANKGLGYLLESFVSIKEKFSDKKIYLVIFGDGPEREALKLQVSSLKLQDLVFLIGDVSNMSLYLKAFDALVLSSTKEGFPYSILESGLAGVPVVATNVGGIGEAIEDEKTGFLIKPKDPQALTEAISKIILDEPKAKEIARELKKAVSEKFDFETMTQKTEWVYKI